MPCNMYGPNDNYHLENSHFFQALIAKSVNAIKKNKKELLVWGTGKPKRELMFSYDFADACVFFLKKKTKETLINIGTSQELSISQYANFVIKKLNARLKIKFDTTKKDGTKRKILDCSIAKKYGWKPNFDLQKQVLETYQSYKDRYYR